MEETIEEMIRRKGVTQERVTPEDIQAHIKDEEYIVRGTLTVCILVLRNGYACVGKSACAHPDNYDAEIGRRIAKTDAQREIWSGLGFMLREKLSKEGL